MAGACLLLGSIQLGSADPAATLSGVLALLVEAATAPALRGRAHAPPAAGGSCAADMMGTPLARLAASEGSCCRSARARSTGGFASSCGGRCAGWDSITDCTNRQQQLAHVAKVGTPSAQNSCTGWQALGNPHTQHLLGFPAAPS